MDVAERVQPAASRDLVAAIDAAIDVIVAAGPAGPALAGILVPGEPPVTRERGAIDPRLRELLLEAVAAVPDGQVARDGPDGSLWRGYRAAVGDGRTAFVLAGAPLRDDAGRAAMAVLVLVRATLLSADHRRSDRLEQLLATARRVAESLDLESLLAEIVQDAARLVGVDSGDMLLWDRDREKLRVVAVWNFPPAMLGFELDFGEGLSSQAILARRTLSVDDYGAYPHRAKALDQYDFGGVLCSPLLVRGEAIGALNVHARGRAHVFRPDDADLLAAFAGHAAIAIDNANRYENEVRLGRLAAETNRELTRSLTVQGRLVEQVLIDGGLAGIASVLAEHLDRAVLIKDHLHRIIAGADPDGGERWRGLADAPPGRGDPFQVAVRIGRDVVGHLVISSDDALDPIDRALVDIATTGVALELARVRAAAAVEERLRGEAIGELLAGSYPSAESIAARMALIGHDLSEVRDMLVIDVSPAGGADATSWVGDERGRRDLDIVRERLAARSPRSVAVVHAGLICVLAARHRPAPLSIGDLAYDLRAALEGSSERVIVTAAIGDPCQVPDDYPASFKLARETLQLLARLGRQGTTVVTSELGPYALLLRASSRDDLDAFASRTLMPLTDYDERHGAELLATLRAYLDEDRVQRRAAVRLGVHVNTVVYRVRRIEALLGQRIANPATTFDLTLALRIVDMLGTGRPAPRAGGASPVRP